MLFTPGNRLDLVAKAIKSGTDAVIVDLEDAVPAESKQQARENLQQIDTGAVPVFVRVNGGDTAEVWPDVVAAGRAPIAGIVLPKAEDPQLMRRLDGALTALELQAGREPGSIALLPLVESARGVMDIRELLASSPRIKSVLYGSGEQGDLVADLGCEWTPEGTGLLASRSLVLLAARAAGIEQPLDAVFMDFRNLDALRTECQLARRLGYVGKVAIHPAQVPVIHEVFTPTAEETTHAREVITAFEKALAEGSASIQIDGRMVDYAVARAARGVLARAEAAERAAARSGTGR
jgi:citrate lyase subunit beta/citryl-CoA lyase